MFIHIDLRFMKSEKRYTKTIFQFQSEFQPQQIWNFLIHPEFAVEFAKDPCYHNEIDTSFKLEKGYQWKEIHTGEDCKGDIVVCKITDVNEYTSFSTVRHQTGIKNTTILNLEKNQKGTIITEIQKFSLSYKNIKPINTISWLMLVTGILIKFSFKPEEDKFWFKKLEEKLQSQLL